MQETSSIFYKNKLAVFTVRKIRKLLGITPAELDRRFNEKNQKKLISNYIHQNKIRKLQIGAQSHITKIG